MTKFNIFAEAFNIEKKPSDICATILPREVNIKTTYDYKNAREVMSKLNYLHKTMWRVLIYIEDHLSM